MISMENHPAYTENALNLNKPVNMAVKTIPVRYCYASIICISIFYERMLNYNQKEKQRKGFIEKGDVDYVEEIRSILNRVLWELSLGVIALIRIEIFDVNR